MRLESSYISLTNVSLYAFHGVLEQERRVGGEFLVSVRVKYNVEQAMRTDDVNCTLNYAHLYQLVKREMATPSQLLEHVAARMAQAIAEAWPQAEAIDLSITKKNPPMGANCQGASVELHLINDKTQG